MIAGLGEKISLKDNLVRTGQAHRTLLGHTGPITCLQFDEIHIASGSLDKTLKVFVIPEESAVYFIFR